MLVVGSVFSCGLVKPLVAKSRILQKQDHCGTDGSGVWGGIFLFGVGVAWPKNKQNKTPPPKNPRSTTPFHSGPVFVERGRDLARLQRIFTKKNTPLLTCCFNVATGEMRNNLGIRVSESADAVADGALFDRVQSCCFV